VNVHSANFSNGEIRGQLGVERPVDYDGDGRTDMSVLRFPNANPAPISWWNLNSTAGAGVAGPFGDANQDFPIPGDYDGDGIADLALIRSGATVGAQSFVYIIRSSNGTADVIPFGVGGDEAVCRDYDGDGITDLAVFRPGATVGSQAFWWIRRSTNVQGGYRVVAFGLTGDNNTTFERPVPGDYDGDGKFDIAVYRSGFSPSNNFIVLRSSDGVVQFQPFGNFNSDYVLPGDYDGDGKYDFAVARTGATASSPLVWWILQSSTGTTRTQTFGRSSDFPTQGDYDGDARTDLAVLRPGATSSSQAFYWVSRSFDNTSQVTAWGLGSPDPQIGGDFPVNIFDIR